MEASILAVSIAIPPFTFEQENISEQFIDILSLDAQQATMLKQLYHNSAINKRHTVISDFKKRREEWKFWGSDFPKTIPGMSERNQKFIEEAPKLAFEAANKALDSWGEERSSITHVISISCTGVMAPGIEFLLMQQLKLNPTVERLGINFMGCFGAFRGLSIAKSIAKENPKNRILMVCTELCSLHFQVEQTTDNILANSLFSDGAAAVIIGSHPNKNESALWEIDSIGSVGLENSLDKMTWEASDQGFVMKLSHKVPVLLGRNIKPFVDDLIDQRFSYSDCQWAIHPGGKSIIQAIEKVLELDRRLTMTSWDVLADYGNMSSATFLFLLHRLAEKKYSQKWILGVGFGPGLSFEGIVLKRPNHEI
ncbi:MAG: type III polyketide synthase [Parachlamydiaceae bacterium]|nr:type III polyketide synthase [Parachlamydiaceae bacterium]